ncbi:hypothetical protein BG006_010870 [Podila minutissima]|uniref:Ser-Thr-rich glycosyl-phosphatidyl-inositol-anchored membrane family-domain-containing protein n=1 Tax=Podila minutissima TaxID=64525 RepID=A0A9P5SF82_9FUNG|nr:hypothetical protein BG006_010870 [Podila minutissima]
MKSFALLLATAVAAVAAQSQGANEGRLYYTSPTTGTIWTAGKNNTVAWSNVCKPENTEDLDIVLYMSTGATGGTEQVRVPSLRSLGKLNCLQQKEVQTVKTGSQYSIHVDTKPLQSYSAQFTINGAEPEVPVAPTSGVPTSTSSANNVMPTGIDATTSGTVSTTPSDPATAEKGAANAAGVLKTLGSTAAVIAVAAAAYMF